jgi:UDP-arabinose 4-epimerase
VKSVLVTGAAGYVGSHCCRAFAQAGWRVTAFDDLSLGWRDFVKWGPLIEGDVRDRAAVAAAIEAARPDVVVHLAGLSSVAESFAEASLYEAVNLEGTRVLAGAMRAAGLDRLVFSSSAAVYGAPGAEPVGESDPAVPLSPYGASKLAAERAAAGAGLAVMALRYFNAAGADDRAGIGERRRHETHLIPLMAQARLRGEPWVLFGDDFPTPDGTAVRDYVHVADLARAHLAAARHLLRGGAPAAVNLGAGRGVSVLEVAAAFERVTGARPPHSTRPRRQGDPPALVAATALARSLLGWRPVRSDIDDIVASAWRWHQAEAVRRPA